MRNDQKRQTDPGIDRKSIGVRQTIHQQQRSRKRCEQKVEDALFVQVNVEAGKYAGLTLKIDIFHYHIIGICQII